MRPVASSIGISFPYGVRYRSGVIHKGIDYSDGREGHDVLSCLDGIVTHAGYGGWGPAYGQHVVIRSVFGGKTRWMLYGHLKTENVKVGQHVTAGQKIGTNGGKAGQRYSGNSTGPHVHVQLGYQNRYDRYLDPAPAIAYQPTSSKPAKGPVEWFPTLGWNLAASDKIHGDASWNKRLPDIIKALKHYDREVYMLVEACSADELPAFKTALAGIGLKVAVYKAGRCVVVRKGTKVGRTKAITLAERGPAHDSKYAVMAEILFKNKGAAVIEVGHLEYRDGAKYDATRVKQAKEIRRFIESTCKEWGYPLDRAVAYNDENSKTQVSAVFGTTWPDVKNAAPFYGNSTYSTLIGWDGKPVKNTYRPDKVHVHKTRPLVGASTSLTFAGQKVSDHLPVIVTTASITK